MSRRRWAVLGSVVFLFIGVPAILQIMASAPYPEAAPPAASSNRTLVVLVHGLPGRDEFDPVVELAKEVFPAADLLVPRFKAGPFSNSDVYRVTDTVEHAIHDAQTVKKYDSIVLVGYSLGAVVLRKVLVWGHGLEDDRIRFPKQGKREWVEKVDRFVSLAGINRGWSLDDRPEHMSLPKYVGGWIWERIARITGTSKMMLSVQRGAPFIADLRVQWLRLGIRLKGENKPLPLTIQLTGDVDDIVSQEDSNDLKVATNTVFITLRNTGHGDIASSLRAQDSPDSAVMSRIATIRKALVAPVDQLPADRVTPLKTNPNVRRIIYISHGIRDYGKWGDDLRKAIEGIAPKNSGVEVAPLKYGFFPMGPFLLYWDRQKNVRFFMDKFTEHLVEYPNSEKFDFIGHSHGSYVLASALQHYRTPRVGRVFFAGSVVPRHYDWLSLIHDQRVDKVVNVAADSDWVVAIFPRLFEQVAEWVDEKPMTGALDIGSAGFRGFADGSDPEGRVKNLLYVSGQHGAALEFSENSKKLGAIAAYAVRGESDSFAVFEDANDVAGWLDIASNVCWLIWLLLAGALIAAGYALARKGWLHLSVYGAGILLLLNSV